MSGPSKVNALRRPSILQKCLAAEPEILEFLPEGTLLTMLDVVAYAARTAMDYSRIAVSPAAENAHVFKRELDAFRLRGTSNYV